MDYKEKLKLLNRQTEAVTSEFKKAREIAQAFNSKRLGASIYTDKESPVVIWGVNISSSGTQSVKDTESSVKGIQQAINVCKKLNSQKIKQYK